MTIYKKIPFYLLQFAKQNFHGVTRRDLWLWAGILFSLTTIGTAIAYFSFRESFSVGDASTFFRFAHNLAAGEVIYKDFIHFRTPGSYFNEALFIKIFGDQMSSVMFAIQFEAHALYTLVFGFGVAIFLRFKKPFIGLVALSPILVLPAYLQLRTALAFLAITLYIQARRNERYRHVWLILSGLVTGWTFIYGQEAAVMVAMTIFVTELYLFDIKKWRVQLRNIGLLATGVFMGLLPLLAYVVFMSDLSTFSYYTLYYAFILQPKGMDLPYPALSYENILYYIVPILIVFCFYIFYSLKEASLPYAILIAFTIARLVTLFGRSDLGHLIFVLPEIFLIATLAIVVIPKSDFNKKQFIRFLPYLFVLITSFVMAKMISSGFVAIGALAVLMAFRFRKVPKIPNRTKSVHLVVLSIMIATIAVFGYTLYPSAYNTLTTMSKRGVTAQNVGGVNTDLDTYNQITAVEKAVAKHAPITMFSYPIQAYYYTFAPKHATRFMTFEPQTTIAEQDIAINDLESSKPEVVVFDPLQAASLSKSLWKINNYITSNYIVSETVVSKEILWIMIPRSGEKKQLNYLAFSLRKDGLNSTVQQQAQDVQSPEKGINSGVMQNAHSELEFKPAIQRPTSVSLSVFYDEIQPTAMCGEVHLRYRGSSEAITKICAQDGKVTIPVADNLEEVELVNQSASTLVWNEPVLLD
ncbi:hypothetical protein A2707_04180 [Candidatus Saccharibacteria bacterium RIFCSPHIGHO2_01_FULL_45_15]|nr:MAG: hypothetical protein A2707_04180 [Candidatus Saccharibacteria bacterium RIFCSPHIGHO2_01_FULL_45_15]OGL32822.1 MAG: hypothetical protein A3E76_05780 [Candidatus Saccharibacteria bacterium RIFCSPHIGHO2_12_FULL_44_22]